MNDCAQEQEAEGWSPTSWKSVVQVHGLSRNVSLRHANSPYASATLLEHHLLCTKRYFFHHGEVVICLHRMPCHIPKSPLAPPQSYGGRCLPGGRPPSPPRVPSIQNKQKVIYGEFERILKAVAIN